MATTNPLVSIGTTANAGQIQTHASDGAYVAAKGSAAADGDYFYQTTDDVIRLFANGAWQSIAAGAATTAGQALVANGSGVWSAAYPTGGPRVMNLGIVNATTTNANDSVKIQGAATTLSASSPLIAVIPSSSTTGLLTTLTATADVTINLTGAHWGMGTNGDFSGIFLRVYAINDTGTLKWGVSNLGGMRSIASGSAFTTATSVTTQGRMLVNSALNSGTWPCFEVGWVTGSFDDTGGAAEDLWAVSSTVGTIGVGIPAPVYTDWASATFTGSWSTNTTYTGLIRRIGSRTHYKVRVTTSGAPTAASFTLTLPAGHVIDTSKGNGTGTDQFWGTISGLDAGTGNFFGAVRYNNTTSVGSQVLAIAAANANDAFTGINATSPMTWANGDAMTLDFQLPLIGWSDN